MGGDLTVISSVDGSTFTLLLPLEIGSEEPARIGAAQRERFDHCRVLLVEDNEVNQMVSSHALEGIGCSVDTAMDGARAVAMVSESAYDLVFMDVRMPIMDGLEATRQIRSRESFVGGHVPIIALTAGALSEERDECFKAGMDGYVSKPFTEASLRAVLDQWCRAT
jgi:CheY-like chemotaxis protein